MKYIITGCGRSGTLYLAKLMRSLELDIGHEKYGNDGIISWYIIDNKRKQKMLQHYGNDVANMKFMHVVRHPLKVITSMRKCERLPRRAALDFFRRTFHEYKHLNNEMELLVRYWVKWNLTAEKLYNFKLRIRIEDLGTSEFETKKFIEAIGRHYTYDLFDSISQSNRQEHTIKQNEIKHLINSNNSDALNPITIDEVKANVPEKLYFEFVSLANKYEYKLESRCTDRSLYGPECVYCIDEKQCDKEERYLHDQFINDLHLIN